MGCANHLRQIGIGLHAYHDVYSTLPSGHVGDLATGRDGGSWGWGALLLPFVEQRPLSDQINTTRLSFDDVATDPVRTRFLQTNVSLYRCPSDPGDGLSHRFRSIVVPGTVAEGTSSALTETTSPLAHIRKPRKRRKPPTPIPTPTPVPTPPEPPSTNDIPVAVMVAKSNYVGSFGSQWKSQRTDWNDRDFRGNGLFGRNSDVSYSGIVDGTSNTLAVGERCMRNYAAVWIGGNSWQGCGFADNQMVLGTAFYPINDLPISQNIDCDGRGSANFSSYHFGGANFLFADGSVHSLSQHIDIGVFQNLAQRDDGENTDDL
ncbi:MAG: DUF1559 domain-containing protein [Pirellulales bacterium]|nr:DUF1559 domain-containing protein [Pirellulales bacterium]